MQYISFLLPSMATTFLGGVMPHLGGPEEAGCFPWKDVRWKERYSKVL